MQQGAPPAIRLRGVTKRFAGASSDAVSGLDLDIAQGELVALIGPSGCGKTTTLRMINRLVEPSAGLIQVEGMDVTRTSVAQLRRGIGYVIQQVGLFPHRNVAANIATVPKTLGWPKGRIAERTAELAEMVGLEPDMLRRYPDELSGGQQQRVGVARALAADPPVLLADEPFGAVDPIVRSRLQDELMALQERLRKTIVLVTHDLDEAIKLSQRVALMNVGGTLEQYATPDELLRAPANHFVERFVGENRSMRRLTLRTVGDLAFEQGPVVDVSTSSQEAAKVLSQHASHWLGITEGGTFRGWVHQNDLAGTTSLAGLTTELPAAQVRPSDTLRSAMELIMTSDTSVAVINDGGRFAGIVTLEQIREGLQQ